jgi:hypothetical protein
MCLLRAWLLGHDPTFRVIAVIYSNELAAELHRQFRRVLEADWYRRLFPDTLLSKDTALEAVTTVGVVATRPRLKEV